MSDDRRATQTAAGIDRDRGRRTRRTAGTRPPRPLAVARFGAAGPGPAPAAARPGVDRTHGETTLVGALQLVEEGLVAAEESYRRVLAVFEASLGEDHPEAADVHRRLSEAERARGRTAEAEHHARRALEIASTLGALTLRPTAAPLAGALS